MTKSNASLLIFTSLILALASPVIAGVNKSIDISDRALNGTPLSGPEGIIIGPDGDIYAGEHDGKIRRIKSDGTVEPFANLNDLPGDREEQISAIGLAMDGSGDIYAATLGFQGGCVFKVIGPGKPDAGKVSLYRQGIGFANFIFIDDETGTMYVSDSRLFSGSVYRFDMNDEARIGSAADAETELLGKFSYANGLALAPGKEALFVAETTKGRVSKIDLKTRESEVFVKIGGWADGLLLDSERQLLFVCDNKGGKIVAVDLSGNVKGEVHLVGKEKQCAPACLVFRDPDTLVFTDLWKASMLDALLGRPKHHSYIYKVPVSEILK